MNLIEIFSILAIHWFADFVLQTDKQAKGKSKNWSDLLSHTITYSWVTWFFWSFLLAGKGNLIGLYLFLITFIFHTTTDYFTSRLNSRLWEKGKIHDFFVSIGFDQLLHYIQLFLTYWILTK